MPHESASRFGEELVRLASADNFRDVTGPGYTTADGQPLRAGVLFRSNELALTDEDATTISELGVTAVYDLRDDHEVEAHPDVAVPGATWTHVEVKGIPMDSVSTLATVAEADEVMRGVYRGFVLHDGGRASFAALLSHLAEADAPQLFHCTAGKDRTGWAGILLLHIAGVADDVIVSDYLLTNTVSSGTREKYLGMVHEHLGADKVPVYERVLVADETYLRAAYDALSAAYGSLDRYLSDGLGLGDDRIGALRARLVAD
ncbi:MAG: tyrosine-protein phosphatase [Actinomycetota bacterium]|nr:tyrosine-protein phosphatase [Actinomycetota bacterium]